MKQKSLFSVSSGWARPFPRPPTSRWLTSGWSSPCFILFPRSRLSGPKTSSRREPCQNKVCIHWLIGSKDRTIGNLSCSPFLGPNLSSSSSSLLLEREKSRRSGTIDPARKAFANLENFCKFSAENLPFMQNGILRDSNLESWCLLSDFSFSASVRFVRV